MDELERAASSRIVLILERTICKVVKKKKKQQLTGRSRDCRSATITSIIGKGERKGNEGKATRPIAGEIVCWEGVKPCLTDTQISRRRDQLNSHHTFAAGSSFSSCSWCFSSASCLDNNFLSSIRVSSVRLAWPTLTNTSTSWLNQD